MAEKSKEVVVLPHLGCPVKTIKLPSGMPPFKIMSRAGLTGTTTDSLSTIAVADSNISSPNFFFTSSFKDAAIILDP